MQETARQFESLEARQPKESWVNVGEPPIKGLKKKGHPERKERCEDVKINDPEKGLFFVGDGVSEANGWFAAQEAAKKTHEILGEELDRKLENIATGDHISTARKQALMIALVQAEVRGAVLASDKSIKSKTELDPRFSGDVATTCSLARLVEMPDRTQQLFVTNVGDSRVFVLRGEELIRLTQDDNLLSHALKEGHVTKAEADFVDQANGAEELPSHLQHYFTQRRLISRAVGTLHDEQIEVKRYQLFLGDRLVLATDGLTDQLKESLILNHLRKNADDQTAERSLQTAADQMALHGTDPRAKGDDISVIVHTITERGPDRMYLHLQEEAVQEEPQITKQQVEAWRAQIPKTEKLLQQKREQAGEANEIHQLETELAKLEYWVAAMDVQEIQGNTPARFEKGDPVRVRLSQGDPGEQWIVREYDPQEDQYLVSHPSGHKHLKMDRFELEFSQTGDLAQPNDKIELPTKDGKHRRVYTVVGEDDGKVVLMHELSEGVERRLESSATVERAIRAQFLHAHAAKKQMERAERKLLDRVN